jgi:hypothetical protein
MSLAMRQARYAQGDPGLFGFLGGIAKGVVGAAGGFLTGGPAGAILGAARAIIPQAKPISVAKATTMTPLQSGVLTSRFPAPLPAQAPFSGVKIGPGGVAIGTQYGGSTAVVPARTTGALVGAGAGTPCTSGYHYNKTAYYTKRYGVVEKGSVCVKNRRRNPLNPRALSRAMSRVKSAQKAVRCLQLFAGPAARASAKAGRNHRGRVSCKRCK